MSSAQQCAHETNPFQPAESRVYPCPASISGRYVQIQYDSTKTQTIMLCEVQVQGGSNYS